MKIKYRITNSEAEMVIDKWSVINEHAQKHLDDVIEKASNIKLALSEQRPLEDFNKVYLDDCYFKLVRKALNPFTHRLKDLIIQLEADPCNNPIANINFDKLKDIQLTATLWNKAFNKAVSEYKSRKQIYEIIFINRYGSIL